MLDAEEKRALRRALRIIAGQVEWYADRGALNLKAKQDSWFDLLMRTADNLRTVVKYECRSQAQPDEWPTTPTLTP